MKRYKFLAIVFSSAILSLALASLHASALDTYWQDGTGLWSDPNNWTVRVPISGDNAYIDNGGTAQITSDSTASYLRIGSDNTGYIVQGGGKFTTSGVYVATHLATSVGGYTLNNGQLEVHGYECIGMNGTGLFEQYGGTNSVHQPIGFCLYGAGSRYVLYGGDLSTYGEIVGRNATFIQSGGTNTMPAGVYGSELV